MRQIKEGRTDYMSKFLFIADNVALDFINTEQRDATGNRIELLTGPQSVSDWLAQAGFPVTTPWQTLLAESLSLRQVIRDLIAAWMNNIPAPADALHQLNAVLKSGMVCTLLDDDYTRREEVIRESAHPLLKVAQAALDLMTEEDKHLTRQCAGEGCVLWFLDKTKNRRRRWCQMATCGNRSKVAAHHRRHHGDTS